MTAEAPDRVRVLSSLRQSVASLTAVQAASYLVPLVTMPYLARVLGAEGFGEVAYVQISMGFLILLVEYGFGWSATHAVSTNRFDPSAVSRIFAATWAAQWLLLAAAAVVLAAVVLLLPISPQQSVLYVVGFGAVVGSLMFPIWLLQGLERMREVAVIQVAGRFITLPFIFVLVRSPEDVPLAIGFNSGVAILTGAMSLCWIRRAGLVRWSVPAAGDVVRVLREGGTLFSSRIVTSLYTHLIPFAIGAIAGPVQLGYFSLADRLRTFVQSMLSPVSQALFPRMSYLLNTDVPGAYRLLKKSLATVMLLAGAAGLLTFFFADAVVLLVAGPEFAPAADILRWLAFVPLVVALSSTLGVQMMIPMRMVHQFTGTLAAAGLLSVALFHPFISSAGGLGGAQLILSLEIFVTVTMAVILRRNISLIARAA